MLADVITFVYEVPFIFWHYINVDGVSWITPKKILQSTMELLQIATAFLLQSATRFITNCDRYYKVRWIYYKLRQVLQSAMITSNCDSTYVFLVYYKVGWTVITNCDSFFYYKLRQYIRHLGFWNNLSLVFLNFLFYFRSSLFSITL